MVRVLYNLFLLPRFKRNNVLNPDAITGYVKFQLCVHLSVFICFLFYLCRDKCYSFLVNIFLLYVFHIFVRKKVRLGVHTCACV